MNNVHHGEFIICQAEVIFFKKKKKKKKQPSLQRANLILTQNNVSLVDPKTNRDRLMFPRNVLINFRLNPQNDPEHKQYIIEIAVWIKEKRHEISIEFPTEDAEEQRAKFIPYFTEDKAKPIENYPNNDHDTNTNTANNVSNIQSSHSQTTQSNVSQPLSSQTLSCMTLIDPCAIFNGVRIQK